MQITQATDRAELSRVLTLIGVCARNALEGAAIHDEKKAEASRPAVITSMDPNAPPPNVQALHVAQAMLAQEVNSCAGIVNLSNRLLTLCTPQTAPSAGRLAESNGHGLHLSD